ncbi:MAG TPA: YncE family protein [Candidatus Acidoferrum sp.]|nr:YncE family protein [Candidatus Acidoferrum sp.]
MTSRSRRNLSHRIILGAFLTGYAASVFAQTSKPVLLVLNKADSNLAIVDPETGKIAAKVPTGEQPHEVAVSADGKLAFVTNYGPRGDGNTISVIDLAARRELHRVDISPLRGPHGVASADGKAYFTAEVSKVIARYDPAENKLDWLMGTGQNVTHMVVLTRDLSIIFAINIGSNSVSAIEKSNARGGWNATVIPVGQGPEGSSLSPDGRELWVANSGDGTVSIIDVSTKKVSDTIAIHTQHSNRLKFTPDGSRVLISDIGDGSVVVVDAKSRALIKRLPLGKSCEGILIAPDGSKAYVAVSGDNHVAVLDLKTLAPIGKLETGNDPDGMAWAPR